ncbi:hypothetical protein EYF80_029410 [Liparis tanakae]|uniref:Uncharacterized protein n=1 Tax=Liparis tanakae TaxID=230148 RepID=A0A4Z2H482_9TELE|nr:hypothetical protein EYF80_029410 [Liparis tanakae]
MTKHWTERTIGGREMTTQARSLPPPERVGLVELPVSEASLHRRFQLQMPALWSPVLRPCSPERVGQVEVPVSPRPTPAPHVQAPAPGALPSSLPAPDPRSLEPPKTQFPRAPFPSDTLQGYRPGACPPERLSLDLGQLGLDL